MLKKLKSALVASLLLAGLSPSLKAEPVLTAADVKQIIQQAAQGALIYQPNSVIAVTDREGFVLGVYGVNGQPSHTTVVNAINKAVTASFLSSTQEAFSSRTAGFIIQPHFPPGVSNTAPGPLVGVGFSNLQFADVNHARNPANPGVGIPGTSLSGMPGGVPLYIGSVLVGGIGVDHLASADATVFVQGESVDEKVAMIGQTGYSAPEGILATNVLINGIRFPYTDDSNGSFGLAALNPAYIATNFPITASTGGPYNPTGKPGFPYPSPFPDIAGQVRDPIIGSPIPTLIHGQPRLSAAEVASILHSAAAQANITRGAIRLPIGPSQNFIVVIDYYATDSNGNPLPPTVPAAPPSNNPYAFPRPGVLGSFRTPDATFFSYDVAAQKARTALFFSNNNFAISTRGVGFLAQGTYPPGIDGTAPGPYYGLQEDLSASAFAVTGNPNASINPFLPDGITIFPGGFPLYRNGVLIGAIGVSGDGVDQDDLISAAGTVNFEAPTSIRSDQTVYNGARLPYAKFPENAGL